MFVKAFFKRCSVRILPSATAGQRSEQWRDYGSRQHNAEEQLGNRLRTMNFGCAWSASIQLLLQMTAGGQATMAGSDPIKSSVARPDFSQQYHPTDLHQQHYFNNGRGNSSRSNDDAASRKIFVLLR